MATATELGEKPPPAQMALSVPVLVKVAEALCVEEVVGVLPSVVRYGTVPVLEQVTVAVIAPDEPLVAGVITGAAAAPVPGPLPSPLPAGEEALQAIKNNPARAT